MTRPITFDAALNAVLANLTASGIVRVGQVYTSKRDGRRVRVVGRRTVEGAHLVDLVDVATGEQLVALPGRGGGLTGWALDPT